MESSPRYAIINGFFVACWFSELYRLRMIFWLTQRILTAPHLRLFQTAVRGRGPTKFLSQGIKSLQSPSIIITNAPTRDLTRPCVQQQSTSQTASLATSSMAEDELAEINGIKPKVFMADGDEQEVSSTTRYGMPCCFSGPEI